MKKLMLLFASLMVASFALSYFPAFAEDKSPEIPKKDNVIDQYFYITDNILAPAYKAEGAEQKRLFKKSIEAYTKLIEWFTDKRDIPTACLAQYQIAESYRKLGDTQAAKDAYQMCLTYKKYAKDPPKDKGDTTIMAVIRSAQGKLDSLPR